VFVAKDFLCVWLRQSLISQQSMRWMVHSVQLQLNYIDVAKNSAFYQQTALTWMQWSWVMYKLIMKSCCFNDERADWLQHCNYSICNAHLVTFTKVANHLTEFSATEIVLWCLIYTLAGQFFQLPWCLLIFAWRAMCISINWYF
jgi:hypothetical protein